MACELLEGDEQCIITLFDAPEGREEVKRALGWVKLDEFGKIIEGVRD